MSNHKIFENDLPDDFSVSGDVAIDTEAMGLNIKRDRLCLVQLSFGDGVAYLVRFEGGSYNAPNLCKLLSDDQATKIFHFARFDVSILRHYLNIDINNIYCTKIASKLVRTYTDGHSLKALCNELLAISLNKQQQSSYWGACSLTQKQINYAASDVLYLHQLRDKLDTMLARHNRKDLARRCFDALQVVVSLDLAGFEGAGIFNHSCS